MEPIGIDAYITLLEQQGEALSQAATTAGLDAEVASCPGWAVRDLLGHTGMVHRWAAAYVRDRLPRGQRPPEIPQVTGADAVEDYRDANAELARELRAAPTDLDCFTLWPDPSPLRFWARRQAHETAVHAIDAALAAGVPAPALDPGFAADGLDELLVDMRGGGLTHEPPLTVRFTAADLDRAWVLAVGPDGTDASTDSDVDRQAPVDLDVTGPVTALHRWAWNRDGTGDVQVDTQIEGDDVLVEWWGSSARIGR